MFRSKIYLRTCRDVSRLLRLRKERVKTVALENAGPRLPPAQECLARKNYLRTSRDVSRLLRLRKEHVKDFTLENVGPRLPPAQECLARKTTSVPAEV